MSSRITVKSTIKILGIFITAIMLTACASKPSRFFVLNPIKTGSYTGRNYDHLYIGLDEVHFPAYLQRPQLVTRKNYNELKLHEFSRWGETLEQNVTSVIRVNLSRLLPGSTVYTYPWPATKRTNLQVELRINRFEQEYCGKSVLDADYRIVDSDKNSVLENRTVHFVTRIPCEEVSFLIRGMNQNLSRLSVRIATSLKSFSGSVHRTTKTELNSQVK